MAYLSQVFHLLCKNSKVNPIGYLLLLVYSMGSKSRRCLFRISCLPLIFLKQANSFMPNEVAGALDTNAIFLFANIVAMVRCTITGILTQLDTLMLMHLSGGTVFSVLSLWGYRTCHYKTEGPKGIRHFGGVGTHLRLLLSMAVACYGLWFWMIGIRPHSTSMDDGPCATVYTFMFAKVRAAGGVRVFYIMVCIMCIIYFGIMLLASSIAGYARLAKIIRLAKLGKWRTTTRLHYATGLRQKQYVLDAPF